MADLWINVSTEIIYKNNSLPRGLRMKRFTVSVALATLLASNILSMKSLAESKPPDFISAAGFERLIISGL